MKYEEYIKKLDNLHEEFEEGLLLELHEKPPANLHGEIMKSINRERKRVNFFNYRIYAPALAAVLVLAVIINRPEILEKINSIKSVKIAQQHNLPNTENPDSKDNLTYNGVDNPIGSKGTDVAINNQGAEAVIPDKNTPSDINSTIQQKNPESNDNVNTIPKTDNTSTEIASKDSTDTSPVKENIVTDKNADEENWLSIANYMGMLFFKEPEINYEIVLDENRSAILNFITENQVEKLYPPNTYKLSSEQFDSLDNLLIKYNIGKNVVNEAVATSSKVLKINFVNYHILINDSAPNILNFIEDQEKCIKITDNTYKVTIENMNELELLLNSSGIKKEFISDVEDEFVIIRTLIINYELNIDASQTAVVSFLKDTEKCEIIQDSIYKMSRESLNKFKELLTNSMIEFKVLNETSNKDILIKVNNI